MRNGALVLHTRRPSRRPPRRDRSADVGRRRRRGHRGVRGVLFGSISSRSRCRSPRTSSSDTPRPKRLGYYAATQMFVGGFQTFFILGGYAVFTRFVPGYPRNAVSRSPVLAAIVLGSFTTVALAARVAFPGPCGSSRALRLAAASARVRDLLDRGRVGVHQPLPLRRGARPWGGEHAQVPGGGLLPVRARDDPSRGAIAPRRSRLPSLWWVTGAIFVVASLEGVAGVARLRDLRSGARVGWFLPSGFWGVVPVHAPGHDRRVRVHEPVAGLRSVLARRRLARPSLGRAPVRGPDGPPSGHAHLGRRAGAHEAGVGRACGRTLSASSSPLSASRCS